MKKGFLNLSQKNTDKIRKEISESLLSVSFFLPSAINWHPTENLTGFQIAKRDACARWEFSCRVNHVPNLWLTGGGRMV